MIKRLMCFLLGHKFGGYEPPNEQRMPDKFFCTRCQKLNPTYEGWL
jgi:hypothetical protein